MVKFGVWKRRCRVTGKGANQTPIRVLSVISVEAGTPNNVQRCQCVHFSDSHYPSVSNGLSAGCQNVDTSVVLRSRFSISTVHRTESCQCKNRENWPRHRGRQAFCLLCSLLKVPRPEQSSKSTNFISWLTCLKTSLGPCASKKNLKLLGLRS